MQKMLCMTFISPIGLFVFSDGLFMFLTRIFGETISDRANSLRKTHSTCFDNSNNNYFLSRCTLSFFLNSAFVLPGRLADELRNEQDHGMSAAKAAKTLHGQSLELQARLDEVEENAIRHGKKVLAKLEERCRMLEGELCK